MGKGHPIASNLQLVASICDDMIASGGQPHIGHLTEFCRPEVEAICCVDGSCKFVKERILEKRLVVSIKMDSAHCSLELLMSAHDTYLPSRLRHPHQAERWAQVPGLRASVPNDPDWGLSQDAGKQVFGTCP